MQYRRFGQTELRMPVLTCGGMRYQQSWQDIDPKELEPTSQENLDATVRQAVDCGINHIETARGYGSSECQLGFILPTFPRDELLIQTKISPQESKSAFLDTFETCMAHLKVDYIDLLSVHGINTCQLLDMTLTGGSLDACRELQASGRVRHVGFSTHGPLEVILDTINSDEFSYVNLHWYYFDQRNYPAVIRASEKDMGVFIISPSDKGGQLFSPPDKLEALCSPLSPMGFNDLFCLSHPAVHTLSIGASRPSDFDAHLAILGMLDRPEDALAPIRQRLERALTEVFDADWADHWHEGLPLVIGENDQIPIYHVVRMYNMAKAFDMVSFGKYRYNLLNNGGHWFPGEKLSGKAIRQVKSLLGAYRFADRIPAILEEAHALFDEEDTARISQS